MKSEYERPSIMRHLLRYARRVNSDSHIEIFNVEIVDGADLKWPYLVFRVTGQTHEGCTGVRIGDCVVTIYPCIEIPSFKVGITTNRYMIEMGSYNTADEVIREIASAFFDGIRL